MNRNELNGRRTRTRALLAAGAASLALAIGGVLPISAGLAYAAEDYTLWEDCDWDGYDDHTGAKVPWPGFDGTKGDTPSGPSQSSQTGKKQAAAEEKKEAAAASSSSSNSSGSASNSSTAKAKVKTTAKAKATTRATAKASATPKATATAKPTASASAKPTAKSEPTPTPSADPSTATAEPQEVGTTAPALASVLATGGEVTVSAVSDDELRGGSEVSISGAGFAAGIADLEVSINSVPTKLTTVGTDQAGAFAATVALPADLPAGEHNVVVAYQGNELVRVPVQVAAPVADSFVGALTVGFAGQNDELLPGLAILGGLVVAGGVSILVTSGARRRA